MNAQRVKQAVVWIVSFATATALSLLLVYIPLETDLDTYSIKYFILTVLPIGFLFLIWGDYLLGANILPD